MNQETRFYTGELAKLVGHRVTGVAYTPADDFSDEFFGLILSKGDRRKILWILRDDEGNGPGSFEVQDEGTDEEGGENGHRLRV